MTTIGCAIPTIPPRGNMLARALRSVHRQTRPIDRIHIATDTNGEGASYTRNRAWQELGDVDLVAFLDDDDEWLPQHIARCEATLLATGADMVYPWFLVDGGTDPFPENFGRPFNPADPVQTTITCLWRREALEAVGGFVDVPAADAPDQKGHRRGEDMRAVERLVALGGKVVHLPEITWIYRHHSSNTSGLPERWVDQPVGGPFGEKALEEFRAAHG